MSFHMTRQQQQHQTLTEGQGCGLLGPSARQASGEETEVQQGRGSGQSGAWPGATAVKLAKVLIGCGDHPLECGHRASKPEEVSPAIGGEQAPVEPSSLCPQGFLPHRLPLLLAQRPACAIVSERRSQRQTGQGRVLVTLPPAG